MLPGLPRGVHHETRWRESYSEAKGIWEVGPKWRPDAADQRATASLEEVAHTQSSGPGPGSPVLNRHLAEGRPVAVLVSPMPLARWFPRQAERAKAGLPAPRPPARVSL